MTSQATSKSQALNKSPIIFPKQFYFHAGVTFPMIRGKSFSNVFRFLIEFAGSNPLRQWPSDGHKTTGTLSTFQSL